MSVTLVTLRTRARAQLDETSARFWADSDLNIWINDACRDMARRAETIRSFNTSITAVAGTSKYTLPTNVIRLHRVEFAPTGQTDVYPLTLSNYQEMDAVWGAQQATQGQPQFAITWGYPPSLSMQVYPVPNSGGTFNLYYYKVPTTLAADSDVAEIPEGWDDAVVDYCVAEARRKDHDPTWAEAKAQYESKVQDMIDVTRQWHDQSQSIQIGQSYLPRWLWGQD